MRVTAVVLVLWLAACETAPSYAGLGYARPDGTIRPDGTVIQTVPEGAVLTHAAGTCLTPCRVEYPSTVEVMVAKAGYQPVRVTVPRGAPDAVVELKPVGRSTAVEELSLPDL